MLQFFPDNCEIMHGEDTAKVNIDTIGKIIVGKFIDREKTTYTEMVQSLIEERKADAK